MKTGGLHIAATGKTPDITIGQNGHIMISGRFMGNNMAEMHDHLLSRVDEYISDPAELTTLDLHIEYLEAVKCPLIISVVRKLMQLSLTGNELVVNWYYEEGDEDMLEQGEYISWAAGMHFNLVMIPL